MGNTEDGVGLSEALSILGQAAERAEAAEAEVERLQAILDGSLVPNFDEVHYPDENGAFAIRFSGSWATALLAKTFVGILDSIGAKNYVQVTYVLDEKPLLVTIMRPDGETPSSRADRLQAEAEALKAAARRFLDCDVEPGATLASMRVIELEFRALVKA